LRSNKPERAQLHDDCAQNTENPAFHSSLRLDI
jgi:hypothetical protein